MTTLNISLTDDQFAYLTALAQAHHQTPEETVVEIVQAALPATTPTRHFKLYCERTCSTFGMEKRRTHNITAGHENHQS